MLYGSVDTLAGDPNAGHAGYNGATYRGGNQVNYYAGLTLNTPVKQLTTGFAFDYVQNYNGGDTGDAIVGYVVPATIPPTPIINYYDKDVDVMAFGTYVTYKATDKLSFNARGEYVEADHFDYDYSPGSFSVNLVELTGTVEYDLWANVVSRLEVRWDQNMSGKVNILFSENGHYISSNAPVTERESVGLYANIVYKF
jgi:hypothetical protein